MKSTTQLTEYGNVKQVNWYNKTLKKNNPGLLSCAKALDEHSMWKELEKNEIKQHVKPSHTKESRRTMKDISEKQWEN